MLNAFQFWRHCSHASSAYYCSAIMSLWLRTCILYMCEWLTGMCCHKKLLFKEFLTILLHFSKFQSDSSLSKISFVFIQEILTRLNFRNIGLVFVIFHVIVASSCVKCSLIFFSWPFQISVNDLKGHSRVCHLILKCHKPQFCIIASPSQY